MKFSKVYRSKKLEELPFDEDQTLEMFEECLCFRHEDGQITELDLRYVKKLEVRAPPRARGDHLFILGWNNPATEGTHPIKEFKLKHPEDFACQFSFNFEAGRQYYTVVVTQPKSSTHKEKSDYLKLRQTPVRMEYMAYYLREAIGVKMKDDGSLDFICMHNLRDIRSFLQRMRELERQHGLSGGSRGPLERAERDDGQPISNYDTVDP